MKNIIFNKKLNFKPVRPGGGTCEIKIEIEEGSRECRHWDSLEPVENPIRLSICGKSRGGSGQCSDFIESKIDNFKKSDQVILRNLLDIWNTYHLNDSKPSTRYQAELLADFIPTDTSSLARYAEERIYLESKGALHDNGHEYGTEFLYRDIPMDVIEFLESL